MKQSKQHLWNTARCGKFTSHSIRHVFVALLFILLFSFVAAAEDNNNSSNGIDYNLTFNKYSDNPRNLSPQPMEFGANVSKYSIMTVDSLDNQTRKHVYIQFYERPTDITAKKLEMEDYGIKLVGRAGGYTTWISSMPASLTPADIPAEAGLRWMGEIFPEDKWRYDDPMEVPERARLPGEMVIVRIRMHDDVSLNDSRQIRDKYANTSSIYAEYSQSSEFDYGFLYQFVTREAHLTVIPQEDDIYSIGYIDTPYVPDETPESDVPSPNNRSTPANSETTESQSVPGFGAACSMIALIFLFCVRSWR
ncbi:hypothetical protein [uncultured Methanolobus sp.]|uniref:hypothetical protein n=1 Tax=uncultured Methanolobus sp. TaxID=218300 RepID=UPI002AAAB9C9|nr:hypothetical protein [uncultured Methanolobus sp.]